MRTGLLFALILLAACASQSRRSPAVRHFTNPPNAQYGVHNSALEGLMYIPLPCTQVTNVNGVRTYMIHMFHVYDPVRRVHIDFPEDSLVVKTRFGIFITAPNEVAMHFSRRAIITHNPADVQYFYAYPGDATPCAVKHAHAK